MAKGQVEGGKALRAARAAEIDAASHRPTAAQKQQQIAELEERAELFGDPVKQSAQAKYIKEIRNSTCDENLQLVDSRE